METTCANGGEADIASPTLCPSIPRACLRPLTLGRSLDAAAFALPDGYSRRQHPPYLRVVSFVTGRFSLSRRRSTNDFAVFGSARDATRHLNCGHAGGDSAPF